jgi:Zn-finger nucleic acid-binding protein
VVRRRDAERRLRCPSCEQSALATVQLEPGLTASSCAACGGHWLASEDYRAWFGARRETPADERNARRPAVIADVQHARLCPCCRHIMLRYRVGHGVDFSIDVCGSCGIWFDRDEWLALKERSLHDDVHLVATEPWQAETRRDEARAHLEALYRRRYGADYDEVLRVRRWLEGHPQAESIVAFLDDPDPFSVE